MSKKIAVSVNRLGDLHALLDPRFGRAVGYVVFDIDSQSMVAEIDNINRQAAHGAGTGAAATLAGNQVNAVISGRYGPKAFQALQSLGIEMWVAPEGITAKEAIDQFIQGKLQKEMSPSGGRGMGGGGMGSGGMGGGGMGGGGGGMGGGGGRGMGGGGGRGMGGGGGRGMGGGGGGGRGMGGGGMGGMQRRNDGTWNGRQGNQGNNTKKK